MFLALATCISLSAPALAIENEHTYCSSQIAQSGQRFFVGGKPNGIMPLEDDTCRYGHYSPEGFIYLGMTTGDSFIEGTIAGSAVSLMGFIPGLGPICFTVTAISAGAQLLYYIKHDGKVMGKYYKSTYYSGSMSWYHIVWVYNDGGVERFLDCMVKTELYSTG
ncbi:hypothetical protein [uncultured Dysosmobacter sp.]|uniref:hypothetical protein n=1 Tax=uncultured Dysosmobacter sp. TaxID=2591384 RepID=UPI00261B2DC9|nr:hypothetical protein [uncultured Dysosmobacter sp.]